ncbi:MAG TPA: hypothetical protein VHC97_14025 [Thermoanaerobaculia bacterium]|jgi:hypothetical protein|nr:hypothetical protein [Thermoanaerobaculia bacterium]
MYRKLFIPIAVLILSTAWIFTGTAEAQIRPSSAVLLPYFEVDLGSSGKTTTFAVGNVLDQSVDIQIEMRTNWGIPVFSFPVTLAAHEVKSFNLRDWILQGNVPGRSLQPAEKAHMKAALAGQRSPKDNLFYSTAAAPNLAVGSIVIRTRPNQPPAALWGDFLLIDPSLDISMGDDLVNLEQSSGCQSPPLCSRHALRFVSGKAVNLDTQVVIWTDRSAQPSKTPYPESQKVALDGRAYNEAGKLMDDVHLRLLPLQMVSINSLGIQEPFGWLDVETGERTFIGLHFDSLRSDGAALQAYCLPNPPPPLPTPSRIELEKRTNGADADAAPGPSIPVGSPVLWEYIVRNTGDSRLTQIEVDDDRGVQVVCPQSALNPGESMTCTGRGTAVACQYENLGTVTAKTPAGESVDAEDPSHYFGSQNAKIDVEAAVNGDDADTVPGPQIQKGSPLQWAYVVTNNGDVNLAEIQVADEKGLALSCPKTSLRPGEAMTCTASGTAVAGPYASAGAATGKPPCGPAVSDSDPVHYFGKDDNPGLKIEKRTNGQHHTQAPGTSVAVGSTVTWSYIVTNMGNVTLTNVKVTDDKVSPINCPKTTLQANESMTCTASGTAAACQYVNTGTAVGTPPSGPDLMAQDWGFYFGQAHPAIDIEKRTNGQDAPAAPGPMINVGSPVNWTYTVRNTGDVALTNVTVTDDKGVAVSCPKTALQAGESMTCTGNGTATAGQYENTGTAIGKPPCGAAVSDSDVSHYYGKSPSSPRIEIKKYTNGEDADAAPGPSITAGDPVRWTYVVTNTGDVALSNIRVTDDKGVAVSCPKTALQPGEVMTCTGNGNATLGQYENIGTVTGTPPTGSNVTDSDPSHYYGKPRPTAGQGCTPGYWKNHTDSWPPTGYLPSQKVKSVFDQGSIYSSLGNDTLLGALSFQGGSTLEGAAGNLLRASVAALLDSAHPNVNYPRSPASVISDVNAALASRNRDTILSLASALDSDNNLGCPLN